MPKRFRLEDNDKTLIITGPWELGIEIDFDDVDHEQVKAEAKQLIAILEEHWAVDL